MATIRAGKGTPLQKPIIQAMQTSARPRPRRRFANGALDHPAVIAAAVIGVLVGCSLFDTNEQTPNYFISFNPSSVTIQVGQTQTINVASSGSPSLSIVNTGVAEIVSQTPTSVTVRGVAPGTTQLNGFSFSASAQATINVIPAGTVLPIVTRPSPRVSAEGLQILSPGPLGTTSFGPWENGFYAAFAGASGWSVVDLFNGNVVHNSTGLTGNYFGVAAASQDPPGTTSTAGFVAFGSNGYAVQNAINGSLTATQIGFGTAYDASLAGGRKITDVLPFVQPGSGVRFVQFDVGANAYLQTSELVPAPPTGELVSSYLHDGSSGTSPLLLLTRDVQSRVWLNQRDGGPSTSVLTLGLDARKLRCIGVPGGGALCGVTLFGADQVATFLWDGVGSVTPTATVNTVDGPVDLDLRSLPNGNVALLTTGFNNGLLLEAELTPAGAVVSSESSNVPAGCTGAGHAVYVEDDAGLKIVGTCYSSNQYYITESRF
jgi:hypothetical protein